MLFRSADLSGAIGYFASLFGRDGVSEISFDMYDALNDRMGGKRLKQAMADGTIEIAPIGFMRGRTALPGLPG